MRDGSNDALWLKASSIQNIFASFPREEVTGVKNVMLKRVFRSLFMQEKGNIGYTHVDLDYLGMVCFILLSSKLASP
jgi:hypothetical protein